MTQESLCIFWLLNYIKVKTSGVHYLQFILQFYVSLFEFVSNYTLYLSEKLKNIMVRE